MVAMRAALTVPNRVCGLILADTHAGPETRFKMIKYEAMHLGARIFGMRRFLPGVVPLMFGKTTLRENPDLVAEWSEHFVAMDLTSVGTTLGALVRRDPLVDRLRALKVPSLVIVGAEDVSLPLRCSEEIASAIPGAVLKIIPKAGHLSALEQPEAVSEAMLGFLEKVYQ
jgi:pimeloyl-ACP methyl ester carboxylesterase